MWNYLLDNLYNCSFLNKKCELELISVHIPKAGGNSFIRTLRDNYGRYLALHYEGKKKLQHLKRYRAVQGHIPAAKYADAYPEAKVIMWMRHPVDRIISYYNYWQTLPAHGNPNHDVFKENDLSLVEFAELDFIKNEVFSQYLQGFDVSQFYFIGILERYQQDLKKLAGLLGWRRVNVYKRNVGPPKKLYSETEKAKIATVLKEEMQLYTSIL